MAAPVLQGRTIRASRRQDGRIYSADIEPDVTPPDVEPGGPFVVATTGAWIDDATVIINTDGYRPFGTTPGTVWLCSDWKYATSAQKIQQNVVSWANDEIVITVSGAQLGRWLMVRDQNGAPIRFCTLEGRAIRARKLRIGVNVPFHRSYNSYATFANLCKHADSVVRHEGTGSVTWDDLQTRTAIINMDPGLVVKMLAINPRSTTTNSFPLPYDTSLAGKYVIRWEGNAQCAYGTYSNVLSSWYNPGQTFIVNYPPAGNDRRATLFWRNNTASPIANGVRNPTMVRINDFPGATDEEKAVAALASWDAGVAFADERMFNPAYISVLKDEWNVRGVRTMDWGRAHIARGESWYECNPPLNSMIWTVDSRNLDHRVPYEAHFALAKAIDAEALYVCVPMRANADFYDNFCQLIISLYGQQLLSGKKLFVERSNEAWNFGGSWRIGAMQGAQYFRGYSVIRCTLDPVTGKYTAPEGHPFTVPWFAIGIAASGTQSLALKTYSGTSYSSADPARELLINNIVDGQFDIRNNVINRKVTDEWVDILPYERVVDPANPKVTTGGGIIGVVDAMADNFAQLKARLPAAMMANVPIFIASQTTNGTIDDQMERWASRHIGAHGPLQVLSVAPYYDDDAMNAYVRNNVGDLTQTFVYGVRDADALSENLLTGDASTGGKYILNNWRLTKIPGKVYSGWNPTLWCYEGGNHTLASATALPVNAQAAENAARIAEGGELMRYWLRTMAATDSYEFIWQYNDMRHDIFGIRRMPSDSNVGRDALMIELKGEI